MTENGQEQNKNMNATEVKEKAKAAVTLVSAISEAIRGLKQVPSGHLYAVIMSKIELNDYLAVIQVLKDAGVVREENHLLIWTGGEPK